MATTDDPLDPLDWLNPLDWLDARVSLAGAADELVAAVPQRPDRNKDATLIVRHSAWGASDAARDAVERIGATGDCRVLRSDGDRLHVRFADRLLEALATRLEARPKDPLCTRRLRNGRVWVVNFIDPNTTKALHIGHLRNIAVGHSLAGAAEACGIPVTRQIRVGDYGRNMGEAMAGYLAYGGERTPESSGIRGDRLVGECYTRYVVALAPQPDASPADAALTREGHVAGDAAERLLERWRAGEEQAVRLFGDLRRWVLEGHEATYGRLGVSIDRTLLESEQLDHAATIVEQGLDTGLFRRAGSGATVYDTGDPEYERFLLERADGFPTQHLRYIATWSATRRLYDGAHTINIMGSEWRHMGKYTESILREIHPPQERHPASDIIYEMVVSESGVVKSSKGGALLIDDILDEILACESMDELRRRHDRVVVEDVAAIVALSRCLTEPVHQRMKIRPGAFIDAAGPGWQLARAWAQAWDPAYDGQLAPDVDDPDYRFLVVRSSLHRRLLANCVAQEQVLPLMRFHIHLANWFTSATPSARLARAMRSVLGEGLVALGLHPTGIPAWSTARGAGAEARG